jgi:hypothetical protein
MNAAPGGVDAADVTPTFGAFVVDGPLCALFSAQRTIELAGAWVGEAGAWVGEAATRVGGAGAGVGGAGARRRGAGGRSPHSEAMAARTFRRAARRAGAIDASTPAAPVARM